MELPGCEQRDQQHSVDRMSQSPVSQHTTPASSTWSTCDLSQHLALSFLAPRLTLTLAPPLPQLALMSPSPLLRLALVCLAVGLLCPRVDGQLNFSLTLVDGQTTPFTVSLTSPPLVANLTAVNGPAASFVAQDSFFSFPGVVLVNSYAAATLSIAFRPALFNLSFLFASFLPGNVTVQLSRMGLSVANLTFSPALVQSTQTYEGSATISAGPLSSFDLVLISDAQAVNFAAGTISGVEAPAASAVGDPLFTGLRGQSFQVHGIDGGVYALISDFSLHLNARFAFLDGPRRCPTMPSTGHPSTACWTHPGSYLSHIALATIGGSRLLIVAGDATSGFASVSLDGQSVIASVAPATLNFTGSQDLIGSFVIDSTHELSITAGYWRVVVENVDGFVNLRHVSVAPAAWSKLSAHGLLGQTWQSGSYTSRLKVIEGDVDDYIIQDNELFSSSFLYTRFVVHHAGYCGN